jgi:hypothetical protein
VGWPTRDRRATAGGTIGDRPPAVGSSGDFYWYFYRDATISGWSMQIMRDNYGYSTSNFGAEIWADATPEPSTLLLITAGVAHVLRRRIRHATA